MAFDKDKAAEYIRKYALPGYGVGKCGTHVREAINAGGLSFPPPNLNAKDFGPLLVKLGFRVITSSPYLAVKGDVIVIQGTSKSAYGHTEFYDGRNWVSDFIQDGMWPGPSYRNEKPKFVVYRYP